MNEKPNILYSYGPDKFASLLSKILQRTPEDNRSASDPGILQTDIRLQRPSSMWSASQPILHPSTMMTSPISLTMPSDPIHNGTRQSPGLLSPASIENRPPVAIESTERTLPVPVTPVPATPSEDLRVLLVEDNEINLKLLVAYMRKLKLEHATAGNGLEALNAYKSHNGRHDVIFMGKS